MSFGAVVSSRREFCLNRMFSLAPTWSLHHTAAVIGTALLKRTKLNKTICRRGNIET